MKFVGSAGARIAFAEYGAADAPGLVLLHSLGMDHAMWSDQVAGLAPSYRILCPDLRGHGASDAVPGPYSIADLADDVLAVVDSAAGGQRVHVCGVSLGGIVALWLGIHRAERLRSLAVAGSGARVGTRDGWQARIDALSKGGLAAARDAVLERFFSREFAASHPDVVGRAGDTLERTPPSGYVGCCAALRDADLRQDAESLSVPLLVMAGERDVASPPVDSRWLSDRVPGSTFVEIEGAGHLCNMERPAAFTGALATFLERHPT